MIGNRWNLDWLKGVLRPAIFVTALVGVGMYVISQISPLHAQSESPQVSEGWEETPYLWAGKTLEQLRPSVAKNILPKYGELRFAYPSADACLTPANPDSSEILGRDLIWYELETNEAVNVCLFRVFTALGDQAEIEAWLENQGFGGKFEVDNTTLGFLYGVEDVQITALTMRWSVSEKVHDLVLPRLFGENWKGLQNPKPLA